MSTYLTQNIENRLDSERSNVHQGNQNTNSIEHAENETPTHSDHMDQNYPDSQYNLTNHQSNQHAERAALVLGPSTNTPYNPFPRAQPIQNTKARSRLPEKVMGYHGDLDTPGPGSYMPPDTWNKKSFSVSATMGKASASRHSKYID